MVVIVNEDDQSTESGGCSMNMDSFPKKLFVQSTKYIRTISNDIPEKEKKSPVKKFTVDQTKRINIVG